MSDNQYLVLFGAGVFAIFALIVAAAKYGEGGGRAYGFNPIRVFVTLAGMAALAWTICCPWWSCRWLSDDELPAAIEQWQGFPEIAQSIAEIRVEPVPLWDIGAFGIAQFHPINWVQYLAIAALCALGLLWARQWDKV